MTRLGGKELLETGLPVAMKEKPEAVVVNVRQIPGEGISRLWQKPRIEVMAYRPEPVESLAKAEAPASGAIDLREELTTPRPLPVSAPEAATTIEPPPIVRPLGSAKPEGRWRNGCRRPMVTGLRRL